MYFLISVCVGYFCIVDHGVNGVLLMLKIASPMIHQKDGCRRWSFNCLSLQRESSLSFRNNQYRFVFDENRKNVVCVIFLHEEVLCGCVSKITDVLCGYVFLKPRPISTSFRDQSSVDGVFLAMWCSRSRNKKHHSRRSR